MLSKNKVKELRLWSRLVDLSRKSAGMGLVTDDYIVRVCFDSQPHPDATWIHFRLDPLKLRVEYIFTDYFRPRIGVPGILGTFKETRHYLERAIKKLEGERELIDSEPTLKMPGIPGRVRLGL